MKYAVSHTKCHKINYGSCLEKDHEPKKTATRKKSLIFFIRQSRKTKRKKKTTKILILISFHRPSLIAAKSLSGRDTVEHTAELNQPSLRLTIMRENENNFDAPYRTDQEHYGEGLVNLKTKTKKVLPMNKNVINSQKQRVQMGTIAA